MKISLKKTSALLLALLALISCANGAKLFSHYSIALSSVHSLKAQGQYEKALNALPPAYFGELLDSVERGRLALLAGNLALSEQAWHKADELIKEQQSKAQIQVSVELTKAGSLLANDNLIPFELSDYELGFFHLYRALSFLQQRNLDSALVEIRRANQVQEQARKSREQALADAEVSLQNNRLATETNYAAVLARYPDAGEALSSVQNGYLFFLSALLHEAQNNANSAFIDYSRALAVAPKNTFIANALIRVAKQQGRTQALNELKQNYASALLPKKGQGQLVILAEQGVIKQKAGWRIPFIYGGVSYQSAHLNFILPHYPKRSVLTQRAALASTKLSIAGKTITPKLLTNVNQMAERSLAEAMPAIVTRQVLRLIAKAQLVSLAAKKDETGFGALAAGIYSIMSEQPDTRSWQTLPERIELFSQYHSKGELIVNLAEQSLPVSIEANRTTLLWISKQGDHFTHWQAILGEI